MYVFSIRGFVEVIRIYCDFKLRIFRQFEYLPNKYTLYVIFWNIIYLFVEISFIY